MANRNIWWLPHFLFLPEFAFPKAWNSERFSGWSPLTISGVRITESMGRECGLHQTVWPNTTFESYKTLPISVWFLYQHLHHVEFSRFIPLAGNHRVGRISCVLLWTELFIHPRDNYWNGLSSRIHPKWFSSHPTWKVTKTWQTEVQKIVSENDLSVR